MFFLFFFFSEEEDGLGFGFRDSVVAVFVRAFTLYGHLESVCVCRECISIMFSFMLWNILLCNVEHNLLFYPFPARVMLDFSEFYFSHLNAEILHLKVQYAGSFCYNVG